MESKTLRHLKNLWAYTRSLTNELAGQNLEVLKSLDHKLLEQVVSEQIEFVSKFRKLIELLGNAGKTSRSIRKHCGLVSDDDDASEDTTEEFFQEIPVDSSKELEHFQVLMDVSNFCLKEVDVKVLGKYLVIHAKHESCPDDHGFISREFTRKFEIPDDVDTETFRALVDCYGVLTVEASIKPAKDEDKTLVILTDTYDQTNMQPYEDLGQGFQERMELLKEDGLEMKEFAHNLAKQRPSNYIPLEVVIKC